MNEERISLSLIIPTYNECRTITRLIQRVTLALKKVADNFEIIIIDDDSPDGTWQIAEDLAKQNSHLKVIRRQGTKGLSTAVLHGWKAAGGEIIGVMDGDLQHPPETLPELMKSISNTDADIAIASRHVKEGGISEWSIIRRVISRMGSFLTTLILPSIFRSVQDPMSGYFLMKRSVIESVKLRPEGYKILLEVLVRGKYQAIIEVPYIFEKRKEVGSKLGPKQYVEFFVHLGRLAKDTGQIACFLRYCLVGLSGVFVNEGALEFFTEVGGLYYVYSSFLAVELAIISNFLLNEFWTFQNVSSQRPGILNRLRRFVKFNLICAIGAILNVAVLWALTDLAGLYYLISNLAGIGVSTLWNFGLNSNITWKAPVELKSRKES
jgi:dolichol-phosphate mannosyltransferase